MKKLFLFILMVGFTGTIFAQYDQVIKDQQKQLDYPDIQERDLNLKLDYSKANNDVARIFVGKAKSQRSFRREETRTISYNEILDVITVTYVLDKETYPNVDEDGVIGMFYSEDRGLTWNGPVVLSDFTDMDMENYYFSSLLYNPTGNTSVSNAYGVTQTVASDPPSYNSWNHKAFGSNSLNGENFTQEYSVNSGNNYDGYFNQVGLTQKSDFVKCYNIIPEGDWGEFSGVELENIHGEFTGSSFDWELEESSIEFPFYIFEDGKVSWVGSRVFSDLASEVVWSDNGQIGYAWMVGIHEDNETGFQPQVYKTTDGGNDWDHIELDWYSDEAQEFLQQYVPLANDVNDEDLDYCIPWFNATVGAVDHRGNLQLFADLNGHYYGPGESAEENYQFSTFAYAGNIVKFTIGEDESGNEGVMDFLWVDSLRSGPAADSPTEDNENLYAARNGWLRRLQLTKNKFSNEFFLTWTDTRDGDGLQSENYHPDVMGWSYNSHLETHSNPICFTEGTLYETFYFYVQTPEYAMYDLESNSYTIPMINAVSVSEFSSNTNAAQDPVEVTYVTGINFPALAAAPPVGIDNLQDIDISVSQNQPNPASDYTEIIVSTDRSENAVIEIVNITGQTVYTMDAGIISGSKNITINTKDLNTGVYFYTVTIGSKSVSKKMIID